MMHFSLGELSTFFNHLPRVVYKKVILSRASWSYSGKSMKELKELKSEDFQAYKERQGWPDKLLIQDSDNELYFDFKNPLAVKVFLKEMSKRGNIKLVEFLAANEKYTVKSEDGKIYANEYIMPLIFEPDEAQIYRLSGLNEDSILDNLRDHSFFPGDEWTYFKVYCGKNIANEIILGLNEVFAKDKWFFIRYSDDLGSHLRFRFHSTDRDRKNLLLDKVYALMKDFYRKGFVSKMMSDSYDREIDRYGQSTIDVCEDLFHHDSIFVGDVISGLGEQYPEQDLWKVVILSLDQYYTDMGFDMDKKLQMAERSKVSYGMEFNLSQKPVKISIDKKFRALRPELAFLEDENAWPQHMGVIKEFLQKRSQNTRKKLTELAALDKPGILTSLLHMHVNRLFKSDQRFNEFVMYYMTFKYYKSMAARMKHMKKEKV